MFLSCDFSVVVTTFETEYGDRNANINRDKRWSKLLTLIYVDKDDWFHFIGRKLYFIYIYIIFLIYIVMSHTTPLLILESA